MSWQASAWALKTRVGDPTLKILLLAIANYADPDGVCWPKNDTLAFDSEVSKRTIQRGIEKLAALGLIRAVPQFDKSGRQIHSKIHLLMTEKGEGDSLSPPLFDTVGVTSRCHGEGDNMVSPPESFEQPKEQTEEQSLSSASEVLACPSDWPSDYENQWWKAYPRKHDKKPAMKVLNRIAKAGKNPWDELIAGTRHYAEAVAGKEARYIKHPATFLNAESWKNRYNRNHEAPKSFLDAALDFGNGEDGEPSHYNGH